MTAIADQTHDELATTIGIASGSSMKGVPTPLRDHVISAAAMGPAKRRKTIGLHCAVQEASSGKGSASPRGTTMALAITGRL